MRTRTIFAAIFLLGCLAEASRAAASEEQDLRDEVTATVLPVMRRYEIPGMAVAAVTGGKRQVFNFGLASLATEQPVSEATLFEIGSISKTFTATLATLAEVQKRLSLNDKVEAHLPSLTGSQIGAVSIVHLGIHSAGGFSLQLPSDVKGDEQLTTYFRGWQPSYAAGTHRTYANPSVGLLGLVAAKSMGKRFTDAVRDGLFVPIGMGNTYFDVPLEKMGDYAQGYTKQGAPIRMQVDGLSEETYGLKTTVADLIRFVEVNSGALDVDPAVQQAVLKTHEGHLRIGQMTQDLVWEQYDCPARLEAVMEGSSSRMIYDTVPATRFVPPLAPRADALLVKSGSTNGFGAFVAFVPATQVGVVIAANRNYPIEERVRIAWRVIAKLEFASRQATTGRHGACTGEGPDARTAAPVGQVPRAASVPPSH